MNTMNPYIYKLPTAETGMNVRGPRNQLAKQTAPDRNVGTWFKDAGKWLLNTLVSPIELITGTNFYDPQMSHSGWQGFDDVFEGTVKGVGDALGYVYGGPMYAGIKEAGTGIADAAGLEDQVAGAQYGGKIKKAQYSMNLGGGNTANNNTNSFSFKYDNTDPRMVNFDKDLQNWITTTYPMGGQTGFSQDLGAQGPQGNILQQGPQTAPQQPGTTPTSGQDYFKNMQHGSQYMSGPDSAQGWSGAVMEAASNPVGATTNLAGSIANAGKDPVVAKDYKTYRDITANTGSHPGDLIKSTADIIAGTDPVSYAFQKKHQDKANIMGNAKKGMRASGFQGMQYGGTMENPYLQTSAINQRAKAQGGGKDIYNKIGQAIQHIGGTVGESLSGMGMGGGGGMLGGMMGGGGQGGGMGGIMDMFGGGGDQGGMMGNIMGMFGGGEGGSGGGFMDAIGGMMGGGEGGGIMSMFGGQNGGRVPVRKGKSPYIATYYYQDGTEVRPAPNDQLLRVDRSKVTPEMIRASNVQQMQNLGKPNTTRTSPVTEQERLDAMMNANSDASRLMNSLGGGITEPNMEMRNQHRMNEIDSLKSMYEGSNEDFLNQGVSTEDFLNQAFQYGGRMPKAQDSITIPARRTDRDVRDYHNFYRKEREELEKKLIKPYTKEDMEYIKRWEQQYKRQHEPFNEYMEFEIPSFKEELPVDSMPMYIQNGGRIPKAQRGKKVLSYVDSLEAYNSGNDLLEYFLNTYPEVELDTVFEIKDDDIGHFNRGTRENMKPTAKIVRKDRRDNDPNNANLFDGNLVADLYDKPTNIPKGYKEEYLKGIYKQNGGRILKAQMGGRLEKTSDLPMDMQGFTDLEPGFRRSNMIEINSGNSHSDLNDPHTPLNVPVPSFDQQGNAMTENVPILAEKGEFARKDPETGAVTIFSKNLGFAKPAEKLGKKEEKLLEKAKNPYDDITDATVQRALSNIKNQFIRLEEEQKVAKELKEEEDRMDLFQLAKNGGRITKKNTYRMGGKVKKLSEYQKDLLGINDEMPKAQYSLPPEDIYDRVDQLEAEEGNPFKKKRKTKAERQKERETRRKLRELKKQQRRGESPMDKIEEEKGIQPRASDLAKQIAELPGGGSEKVLDPYTNDGARKAKELIEKEYGPLTPTGGLPQPPVEEPAGGGENVECPPCEDGTIPTKDKEGNCSPCPEEQEQQQRRASSGTNAINDYIRNLRNINADVENRFEPYPNFFEDYGRESESIARNALTDLPEWYMDRASQLASANVNSLENAIRNMGQSMGTSGYLAQMQAAKNKELAANQGYAAQAAGQREKQLGQLSALMAQNELYDRTGAEKSFDLTQEALDAIDAAKYDTEKNILTGRLAQEREANAARRNELLDAQMQWMYKNDRTQYDEEGNETTPSNEYGGKIKRNMYEYGSRVKRERQMKSDKAINEFRSFMRGFNKK